MLWLIVLTAQFGAGYSTLFAQSEPDAWFSNFTDAQDVARYKPLRSIADLKSDATGLRCRITGNDPILQGPPLAIAKRADYLLRGRVFSEAGGVLQVFVVHDGKAEEKLSVKISVPAKTWHEFTTSLSEIDVETSLRIDPPGESGEFQLAWLNIESPGGSGIINIRGDAKELVLKLGRLPTDTCELVELPLTVDWSKVTAAEIKPLRTVTLEKEILLPRHEQGSDRLLHGFAIRRVSGQGTGAVLQPIGWPHYADQVAPAVVLPPSILKPATSIKGLQIQMLDDALALGIQHATYNVSLASLLDLKHDPANPSLTIDGEKFSFRRDSVSRLPIKQLNAAGVRVYLILLGTPSNQPELNRLLHPAHSAKGRIAAFNTVDESGLRAYRACLTFLAQYFSGSEPEHGEVSGWIIGNEVNSHRSWYNLGNAGVGDVAKHYARALRAATTIAGEHAPRCRVYVSLDHHWNIAGGPADGFCKGRELLDELNRIGKLSGEIPWHVAYHPYPENLREPRSWLDKAAKPALDTPKITFKNIEQLVAYLKQPALQLHGETRRVILSEQGCDTPLTKSDAKPDGEQVQAAGYCYAWVKISRTPGIDAFVYHRHVDHRDEDGLQLGLWTRKPDSIGTPDRKKTIYGVFQKADQHDWERAYEFALPLIGVKTWDEVAPR